MRVLIFLIRSLVYSNLFVSICVTLLAHQSYLLLNLPQQNKYYLLIFVFCATFSTYNIQRIIRINYQELIGKQIGIRLSWIVRNRKILFILSIFSSIICFIMLFFLNLTTFKLIIPLALLSVFYVVPIFKNNAKKIALRNLPYVKIIIISLVWSLVSTALPFINHSVDYLNSNFIYLLIEQFIFIIAITLPFDIRDLKYDIATDVKTVPSKIGINKTILLSLLLLCILVFLKYQQYGLNQISTQQFVSTCIATAISGLIILFSSPKRPELFFSGLIEGIMVIMYFSVVIFEY